MLGALIIRLIVDSIVILDLDQNYSQIIVGSVIVAAATLDRAQAVWRREYRIRVMAQYNSNMSDTRSPSRSSPSVPLQPEPGPARRWLRLPHSRRRRILFLSIYLLFCWGLLGREQAVLGIPPGCPA